MFCAHRPVGAGGQVAICERPNSDNSRFKFSE